MVSSNFDQHNLEPRRPNPYITVGGGAIALSLEGICVVEGTPRVRDSGHT